MTCSCASTASDGRTRTSGGLETAPRTTATLTPSRSASVSAARFSTCLFWVGAFGTTSSSRAQGRDSAEEVVRSVGRGCDSYRAPRASEAFGDVGECGVVAAHAAKSSRALRQVARAFGEVGERRTRRAGGAPRDVARCRPRRSRTAIASRSRPRSASDPASTMRPSVTSAPDGDAAASSSHSSCDLGPLAAARARSPSARGAARPSR